MASIKDIGQNVVNKIPGVKKSVPNLKSHLLKVYSKSGYLDKYGASVIISSLILITFVGFFGYNYFLSNLKHLKRDWTSIRCNPLFIPFAGLINAPRGTSKMNYTVKNLNYCLTDILKDVAKVESAAQSATTSGLHNVATAVSKDMNNVDYSVVY